MPQKKNPDVAELVRGKTGRIFGNFIGLLTTLKGLPLTYNKDMQEDKEGMFDTIDTLAGALALFAPMLETMQVNADKMLTAVREDFSNATDLADYLVNKGLPFREAHEVIGTLVAACLDKKCFLLDLSLTEFQKHSELFADDLFEILQPETVVAVRSSRGGTGGTAVALQVVEAEKCLATMQDWIQETEKSIILDIEALLNV